MAVLSVVGASVLAVSGSGGGGVLGDPAGDGGVLLSGREVAAGGVAALGLFAHAAAAAAPSLPGHVVVGVALRAGGLRGVAGGDPARQGGLADRYQVGRVDAGAVRALRPAVAALHVGGVVQVPQLVAGRDRTDVLLVGEAVRVDPPPRTSAARAEIWSWVGMGSLLMGRTSLRSPVKAPARWSDHRSGAPMTYGHIERD